MRFKTSLFITLLCLLSAAGFSQSITKPLPLYKVPAAAPVKQKAVNVYSRSLVLSDTIPGPVTGTFKGLRLAGPDIMAAIPDFTLYTGLGIDYVVATPDPTTGKWNSNFTIGPRIYGGANLSAPSSVKAVAAVGIRASFFNGLLAIGAIYNLTTKKIQGAVGNPAALIPGLN